MKNWSEWEIVRRQVAIGGCVVDGNKKPLAGVMVKLIDTPDAFKQQLKRAADAAGTGWNDLDKRPDRVQSRQDGIYFFLDLPDGEYVLEARDPQSGLRQEQTTSVSNDDRRTIELAQTNKWEWSNTDFTLMG